MTSLVQPLPRVERPEGESFAMHGLAGMFRRLASRPGATVMDMGLLSQSRINDLAGRLGLRVRIEDLLRQAKGIGLERAVKRLELPRGALDGALMWNLIEYLPPETAADLIRRVWASLKPGGLVAGLFRVQPPAEERILQFEMPLPDRVAIIPLGPSPRWRLLSNRDVLQAYGQLDPLHSYSLKARYTEFLFRKVEREPDSLFD